MAATKLEMPAKPVTKARAKLPPGWKLFRQALQLLWRHRKLFLGITGIYAVLSVLLVQNLDSSLSVSSLQSVIGGSADRLSKGVVTVQWLASGSGSTTSQTSNVFQGILFISVSLAIIWALRQVMTGHHVRIRDAFYRGMYPVVPVLLVAVVFILQLLPASVGLGIYNVVLMYSFAAQSIEKILWAIPVISLVLLSLYVMTSSTIALYIATLPDITPIAALKSARGLVHHRRWVVLRKLLFLSITLAVIWGVLAIPVLLLAPLLAPWLVFVLGVLTVPVVHAYIYLLYRELLV